VYEYVSRLPSGGQATHPSSLISLLEIKRPLTPNPVTHFNCRSRVFVVTCAVLKLHVNALCLGQYGGCTHHIREVDNSVNNIPPPDIEGSPVWVLVPAVLPLWACPAGPFPVYRG
jgi:hypothetical protein